MLDKLFEIEKLLPALLRDPDVDWKSLYVDYHPPIVERLWLDISGVRLYLHRIHSCTREEALFHPHPWPSAMRIVEGEYEMGIGYSPDDSPPTEALTRLIVTKGVAYCMEAKDSWHYVSPISSTSLSVMVTGQPWGRPSPKPDKKLRSLTEPEKAMLLADMQQHYPQRLVEDVGDLR